MADKKNVWVGGLILSCLIAVIGFGFFWILGVSYLLLGLPIVAAIIRGVYCFKFQKKYIVVIFLTSVIISLIFCFMGWFGGLVYTVIPIFAVIGVIKENRQQTAIVAVSMLFTIVLLLIFSLINWDELPLYLFFVILIISDLAVLYKFGLDEFMDFERIKSLSKAVVVKKMYFTENSLEALKEAYKKGEISEEEYDRRKTEIINSL